MCTHQSWMRGDRLGSIVSLSIILLVLAAATGADATDHTGTIAVNETWLAANNPHVVVGHVSVNAGVTLTIAAGAEVYFNSNMRINVYGTLLAPGTMGNEITFEKNTASAWYGLRFLSTGQGTISYGTLDGATYGIDMSSTGTVTLANTTIRGGIYGMNMSNGTVESTDVTLADNTSYGYYCSGVVPTLLGTGNVVESCGTGIYLNNIAGLNLASAVTIRDNTTTGIEIVNCDNPTLDNMTFTGNVGAGGALSLANTGEFILGAGNSFGGTGLENSWALTIKAGSYPSTTCVIPTTGNTNTGIRVAGGSSDRTGTWRKFTGLDYIVTTSSSVSAGGELTIADEVNVLFNSNQRLNIYGTLTAVGTPGGGILLTRNGTGNWYGVRFLTAGQGDLDHCTIEHSSYGLDVATSGTVAVANTTIRDGAYGLSASNGTLELTSVSVLDQTIYGFTGTGVVPTFMDADTVFDNCGTGFNVTGLPGLNLSSAVTIRNNTSAGVAIVDCDNPTLDNLTLTGNTGANGAVYMNNVGEFTLGGGNTIGGSGLENTWAVTITAGSYPSAACVIPITGNSNTGIRVAGGSSDRTGTWRKFADLDFIVATSSSVSAGGELIIADEVNVLFNSNQRLNIYGTLTAIGTPGGGILLTRNGTGNWYGVRFITTGQGDLDHCTIEHSSYGLDVATSGTVAVANTTIRDGSYGLSASNGALELTSVSVLDQTIYGFTGTGVVPTFMDADTVFDNCGTGINVADLPGANLTSATTIRNNTIAGVSLNNCENAILDNLTLTGNTGTSGAVYMNNTGEFTIGGGNTIGGSGLENTWAVTITAGSYPSAACAIPITGNTNTGIRVAGGTSDRTGTWRHFPGRNYIVAQTMTVSAGGELIIADEVTALFNYNQRLNIYGTLTAIGSEGQGIRLAAAAPNDWYGIRFLTDANGTVEFCTIEQASYGVYSSAGSVVDLTSTTITDGNYGVYADAGTVNFLNSRIHGNSYGVHVGAADLVFGQNLTEWNDIYDNGGGLPGRNMVNTTAADVHATYVYWGVTYWWDIETSIHDVRDDETLGKIHYIPWTNTSHDNLYSAADDDQDSDTPARFAVYQNFPNPFNAATTIRFDLERPVDVDLKIYDLSGRLITTLIDGPLPAAVHRIPWHGQDGDGRTMASGVYVYRLIAGERTETKQMVLVQ